MTTFYNLALKIETSWAKKVIKPILETWNTSDVVVHVWFINSRIKKFKNMQCKKNNSKCTIFTIKTKIIQIESKIRSTT